MKVLLLIAVLMFPVAASANSWGMSWGAGMGSGHDPRPNPEWRKNRESTFHISPYGFCIRKWKAELKEVECNEYVLYRIEEQEREKEERGE